jgi:hypothetical protein
VAAAGDFREYVCHAPASRPEAQGWFSGSAEVRLGAAFSLLIAWREYRKTPGAPVRARAESAGESEIRAPTPDFKREGEVSGIQILDEAREKLGVRILRQILLDVSPEIAAHEGEKPRLIGRHLAGAQHQEAIAEEAINLRVGEQRLEVGRSPELRVRRRIHRLTSPLGVVRYLAQAGAEALDNRALRCGQPRPRFRLRPLAPR